jgi:hypothetical protein
MFLSGLSGDIPQVIEKLLESDEQQFFFALEIVICETARNTRSFANLGDCSVLYALCGNDPQCCGDEAVTSELVDFRMCLRPIQHYHILLIDLLAIQQVLLYRVATINHEVDACDV